MNITLTGRDNRDDMFSTENMVPTTSLSTRDIENFWSDFSEVTLLGLASLGGVKVEISTDESGYTTHKVDFAEAVRASLIYGNGRARRQWDESILQHIKNPIADDAHFIKVLGSFLIAAAHSRPDWTIKLTPLPGFNAADHEIFYGIAVRDMVDYMHGRSKPKAR